MSNIALLWSYKTPDQIEDVHGEERKSQPGECDILISLKRFLRVYMGQHTCYQPLGHCKREACVLC